MYLVITKIMSKANMYINNHPSNFLWFLVGSCYKCTRSLVLYVCFVDRCMSFCPFFFWTLCCLSFFDLRILVTLQDLLTTVLPEDIQIKINMSTTDIYSTTYIFNLIWFLMIFLYNLPSENTLHFLNPWRHNIT